MSDSGQSNATALAYRARCGCGAFSVEFSNAPAAQLACHCSDCRSLSGKPFLNVAFFTPDSWQINGRVSEKTMTGGSGRSKHYLQCAECGQALGAKVDVLKGMFGAVAESLEPPLKFRALCHVWTSEKLPETDIPEGVPAFPKGPPTAPGR